MLLISGRYHGTWIDLYQSRNLPSRVPKKLETWKEETYHRTHTLKRLVGIFGETVQWNIKGQFLECQWDWLRNILLVPSGVIKHTLRQPGTRNTFRKIMDKSLKGTTIYPLVMTNIAVGNHHFV